MEDRAEVQKEKLYQIEEDKLKRRKKEVQKIILNKRIHAQQNEETLQKKVETQEVIEVEMEETEVKGFSSCTMQRTRTKWKCRKKCWYCGSSYHFKKNCPKIRYFQCHRLGHMKAQCFMKKINKILEWMGKTIKEKEVKKKQRKEKKEKRRKMIENLKLRAKQTEFVKQGEKWILMWKGDAIGDFIGPGTPITTEELRKDTFRWDPVDVLTKKKIPLQKMPLIDGFASVCGCNGVDYSRIAFKEHVKDAHRGYIPPLSQINQPPWNVWLYFYDNDI